MTLRVIARNVTRGARILDVGGGPGAYLRPLVEGGFDPYLCDLSAANVKLARVEARALGLWAPSRRVRIADATDLGVYQERWFDAALVAGPLYHLVDAAERERALAEVLRVVVEAGVVLFNVLPRLHPLRYLLREASRGSRECWQAIDWDGFVDEGRYENPFGAKGDPAFFTDAYFCDVEEFEGWLRGAGCTVLETLSAESFCAFMDVPLARWVRDESDYQQLLALVERTARRRDQIGAAEHVLVCARTPVGHGRGGKPRRSVARMR